MKSKIAVSQHGFKTGFLAAILAFFMVLTLSACSPDSTESPDQSETPKADPVDVEVSSLKGPTSIGLVDFIHRANEGEAFDNNYTFTISGTADEVLPRLINGETDIALIPANTASIVYNKTEGGIQVLNINTLGVLYVVSADESISSLEDLAGRQVLSTGKGTSPEYVLSTLLDELGLSGQVQVEYKSEATELAAVIASDPNAIAILPEPYVTAVLAQNETLGKRISLTEEWKEIIGEDLVTGVTVVRTEFAQEHPEVVAEFMKQQADSVSAVNADPATAASYVVETGIIDNENIAKAAIPGCNLVNITGADLKSSLTTYLTALLAKNPESIGGALPDDNFYYDAA